jgi:hypothetical protein
MLLSANEPYGTLTPTFVCYELPIPAPMILVVGIKGYQWTSKIL